MIISLPSSSFRGLITAFADLWFELENDLVLILVRSSACDRMEEDACATMFGAEAVFTSREGVWRRRVEVMLRVAPQLCISRRESGRNVRARHTAV